MKTQHPPFHEVLKKKLKCPLDDLVIDATTERITIQDADRFHTLLQQHKIKEISNGGGYHFVLSVKYNRLIKYWKITLAAAENKEFEQIYARNYTIRSRKRMPGAFY